MIFDIGFERKKDRRKFEKMYKIKQKNILVSEKSDSCGFGVWAMSRNLCLDVVYYMGFLGYYDPQEILRECRKAKINIKFLAFIPLNDRNSHWEKIKGRW